MKFQHSAFIENTPEAREWLRSIDYTITLAVIENEPIIFTTTKGLGAGYINVSDVIKYGIDCRSNLPLFKAITAMRDDSDYMQWFISESFDWFLNISLEFEGYLNHESGDVEAATKATLSELIERFNK